MSATPWDALHKFAGMPLPAQLSPMAAYRYLSLGAGSRVPPGRGCVAQLLHDIWPKASTVRVSSSGPCSFRKSMRLTCRSSSRYTTSSTSLSCLAACSSPPPRPASRSSSSMTARATRRCALRTSRQVSSWCATTGAGLRRRCNAGAERARGRYIVFLNKRYGADGPLARRIALRLPILRRPWASPAPASSIRTAPAGGGRHRLGLGRSVELRPRRQPARSALLL